MGDHKLRLLRAIEAAGTRNVELLRSRLPWYYVRGIKYDPPFAHFLDDDEIQIVAEWFRDTTDDPMIGDSGFIAPSMITELILTNEISQAIQLGHYAGLGSLVMGFMLRKVSPDARLVSFDIDSRMNDFCNALMERVGLAQIVQHVCIDSTDPLTAQIAGAHLKGEPGLIFIDASKQYKNTITEVSMWSRYVHGYIVCHDVSMVAKGDQANGAKGVSDGLIASKVFADHELLILDPQSEKRAGFPYLDPCGLGIGVSRGSEKLPRPDSTIDEMLAARRILEPNKLSDPENWFFDGDFTFNSGRLIKARGSDSWATCFAPIEVGQRLKCEVTVKGDGDFDFLVCAGGGEGTSVSFRGAGDHSGEFIAGGENSRVGILGLGGSEFSVERIRISAV